MMKRLSFETDPELDQKFPSQRICRAEIYTTDRKLFVSKDFEPGGEAHENIGIEWLSAKFHRIAGCVINEENRKRVLDMALGDEDLSVRKLVDSVNSMIYKEL